MLVLTSGTKSCHPQRTWSSANEAEDWEWEGEGEVVDALYRSDFYTFSRVSSKQEEVRALFGLRLHIFYLRPTPGIVTGMETCALYHDHSTPPRFLASHSRTSRPRIRTSLDYTYQIPRAFIVSFMSDSTPMP